METFKFFSYSILLSFTFGIGAFAQTAQFEQPFIFSDEFNNTQELIIGYDPFGSNGLNPDLGEVVIPQVLQGEFGVRFQLPPDTSITTLKDIRFGCGQLFYYEHLIDLSYLTGSSTIEINWSWIWPTWYLTFINPINGDTLAILENNFDPPYFSIPSLLDKIKIEIFYDGPLSWQEYEVITPNGGELIPSGQTYTITWWDNNLFPWITSIDFSADSGDTWDTIADTVWSPNNSFVWNVPQISSDRCLIRLGSYPCSYDQSDNVFTITYPVIVENETELPTKFSLSQNYPNPFNPTTTISYEIPDINFVTLKVYDVLGNEVVTLVNEEKPAGIYEVAFNAKGLPSGIYYYQLRSGDFVETKKMVLLK